MATINTTAAFGAFTDLSTELLGAYNDSIKKADPSGITSDVTALQSKLIVATLESLTDTVKQFRKAMG
jgi:hypothetical protein